MDSGLAGILTLNRPVQRQFFCFGLLAIFGAWWAAQIRAGGDVVRWPYAATPTAPIHERDIAAVAVRALREDGHAARSMF